MDIEATRISKITHISEGTLCKIFKQIRILIAKECEKTSKMQGEIEIDESYFGAKRVCGKRGRGSIQEKHLCFCFVTFANVSSRMGYAKHRLSNLKELKKNISYYA